MDREGRDQRPNDPVLFPIGSPGTGAQNCVATNEDLSRAVYAKEIIAAGRSNETLLNIMTTNSTGIMKELVPGENFPAEIKIVSAVTLRDVLGPFDVVDTWSLTFSSPRSWCFRLMDLVKRKVRRVHIGTHGDDVHSTLLGLFQKDGWEIVFNYAPNAISHTAGFVLDERWRADRSKSRFMRRDRVRVERFASWLAYAGRYIRP